MSRNHSFFKLVLKTAAAAGAIYAVNEVIDRYATEKKLLTYHSGNMFTWRDIKIYYTRQGSGSPIILLHNLDPAFSSYEWNPLISQLALNHTVYTVDLPGCGRSDKHKQPYTNFYYVEFLREFIHEMGLSSVSVVASNLSASVALMTAVYEPTIFEKLILISPPDPKELAVTPDTCSKLKKEFLELPLLGTLAYNLLYAKPQVDFAFTEQYLYNPFHENTELVDASYESAHLGHGQGRYLAASLLGGYLNINIEHALSTLKVPTLILEGANTENASQIALSWCGTNSALRSEMIEHTKLLPHLEEPEAVIDQIVHFIG